MKLQTELAKDGMQAVIAHGRPGIEIRRIRDWEAVSYVPDSELLACASIEGRLELMRKSYV